MLKDAQIYIGNMFVGDINHERFVIVDIKNDNGNEYAIIENEKKIRSYIPMNRLKSSLFSEIKSEGQLNLFE